MSLAEDFMKKREAAKASTGTKIPALLFKAQLDAHITHLEQKDKTLATHTAMEKFYEEIDDIADTFTETYMGLYPPLGIKTEGSEVIKNPVEYFTNLYNQIETERKPIKETFLQNQIDEMQQLISHTLYRLKLITD